MCSKDSKLKYIGHEALCLGKITCVVTQLRDVECTGTKPHEASIEHRLIEHLLGLAHAAAFPCCCKTSPATVNKPTRPSKLGGRCHRCHGHVLHNPFCARPADASMLLHMQRNDVGSEERKGWVQPWSLSKCWKAPEPCSRKHTWHIAHVRCFRCLAGNDTGTVPGPRQGVKGPARKLRKSLRAYPVLRCQESKRQDRQLSGWFAIWMRMTCHQAGKAENQTRQMPQQLAT